MADILLDEQSTPATPASGQCLIYPDNVNSLLAYKNDAGRVFSVGSAIRNWSVGAQATGAGTDTYLTGSALAVPQHFLQVGTTCRWRVVLTKSAAGTASPSWIVRVGTGGVVGDTARITFTQVALQTAAADTAWVEIEAVVRTIGAAGVMAGGLRMSHVLAATGFSTLDHNVMQVTSAGFDMTVGNLIVGLSANPGASGVWTFQIVSAEMLNI